VLFAAGLLTYDPRVHERQKVGQYGARRKYTWYACHWSCISIMMINVFCFRTFFACIRNLHYYIQHFLFFSFVFKVILIMRQLLDLLFLSIHASHCGIVPKQMHTLSSLWLSGSFLSPTNITKFQDETLSASVFNAAEVGKICEFWLKSVFISETVWDKAEVTVQLSSNKWARPVGSVMPIRKRAQCTQISLRISTCAVTFDIRRLNSVGQPV